MPGPMIGCGARIAALSLLAAAWANTALADPPTVPSLPDVAPEQEAFNAVTGAVRAQITTTGDADADVVLATEADVQRSDLVSVRDHEADLRQVLAHMPQPFVRERTENGRIFYRGDRAADCVRFALTLPPPHTLICEGNPYPSAAFYLGSYLNEVGQPDDALAVLDLGRIAGPDSPVLATERDASLMALHRWDEALAGADRGLSVVGLAPLDRARLLRNRGYALTELKRLDEAQAAYEDSLKLDPGNKLATNELTYLAGLKAGAAPGPPGVLFRPNAPQDTTKN